MQNQINDLDKLSILEQYIEDDAQFRKSVKKLLNTNSDSESFFRTLPVPFSEEIEYPEIEDDEYEILSDFVDPFNQAEPIVRDYILNGRELAEPNSEEIPVPVKRLSFREKVQQRHRKKQKKQSEPTHEPKFVIGQTVNYSHNGKLKIGKIVDFIWDTHYEEYKYYFSSGIESYSYLKENVLESRAEEQAAPTEAKPVIKAEPTNNKKQSEPTKKIVGTTPTIIKNNSFKEFNDQFDFICQPYSRLDLKSIYNGMKLPTSPVTNLKKDASKNAFFDMVMEQINISQLLKKDRRGYYTLNNFINYNRLNPNEIIYLKYEDTYTVTEHFRINPKSQSKRLYYKVVGIHKNVSELALYKKMFDLGHIDWKRYNQLKNGEDSLNSKELFQTNFNKLTFKKHTAKVYQLNDQAMNSLVCALLFRKIQKLSKFPSTANTVKNKVGRPKNAKPTTVKLDNSKREKLVVVSKRLVIIESALQKGLAKYGFQIPKDKQEDFSLSQSRFQISPTDFAKFLLSLQLEKQLNASIKSFSIDFYDKLLKTPLKSLKFTIYNNLKFNK